ncbi:hypothetical protein L9F63_014030, partial [Diploptera punctata]
ILKFMFLSVVMKIMSYDVFWISNQKSPSLSNLQLRHLPIDPWVFPLVLFLVASNSKYHSAIFPLAFLVLHVIIIIGLIGNIGLFLFHSRPIFSFIIMLNIGLQPQYSGYSPRTYSLFNKLFTALTARFCMVVEVNGLGPHPTGPGLVAACSRGPL